MYYYILEAPPNRAVRQQYLRLRDILTNLSIAGEMVGASPARTPTELAQMGIQKGYTTIVAVGGDWHINEIAVAVRDRAVLGIIPIGASAFVTDLIGTGDLRAAAESLKLRRVVDQKLLFIEPETLVFLDCFITSPKLAKANLIIDNKVRVHAHFNHLRVTRALEMSLHSAHFVQPKRVLGLFTVKQEPLLSESLFHGKTIRLVTDPELPLTVAGRPVATTPAQLRSVPDSLKVIAKRGIVSL